MNTETPNERLDEMRRRLDALEARARAAGVRASESIKAEIEALRRQEASARAALREEHRSSASEASEHADPTKDQYYEIEKRLGAVEDELAEEIAHAPRPGRPGAED
jgi:chromosome segregation ATPase